MQEPSNRGHGSPFLQLYNLGSTGISTTTTAYTHTASKQCSSLSKPVVQKHIGHVNFLNPDKDTYRTARNSPVTLDLPRKGNAPQGPSAESARPGRRHRSMRRGSTGYEQMVRHQAVPGKHLYREPRYLPTSLELKYGIPQNPF